MLRAISKDFVLNVFCWYSASCLVFGCGLAVGHYRIFPFNVLRDAKTALGAITSVAHTSEEHAAEPLAANIRRPLFTEPTVKTYSSTAGKEWVMVTGGAGYQAKHHPDGCLAWLMDRQGQLRHYWKFDWDLWDDLQHVTHVPTISGEVFPVGLHLFPDGDLLVNFQGRNTFPFAVGLARFDKNSHVRWKQELLTHHWFSVATDGRIFVPAVHVVDSPVYIGLTESKIEAQGGKIYDDQVLILDHDGNQLDEISMLDALCASGLEGLLVRNDGTVLHPDDPLHLNDVQLVTDEQSEEFPWLSTGDLLVSFRNINTVGILDATTRQFKWTSAGATIGQHSPRFYDHGVLIVDNLGGEKRFGGTQLVKVDLDHLSRTSIFPRAGVEIPEPCFTMFNGHLDLHRDRKRALLTLTSQATIWEIDLQTGEVLWEYVYVHPDGDGTREEIRTAKYVYDHDFLEETSDQ